MFIRVKERNLKLSTNSETSLRFYVVDNQRIHGKPRQHVVCYLASVHHKDLDNPEIRAEFLMQSNLRLSHCTSDFNKIRQLKSELINLLLDKYVHPVNSFERQSHLVRFTKLWFEGQVPLQLLLNRAPGNETLNY
jgi:hypothetical protein